MLTSTVSICLSRFGLFSAFHVWATLIALNRLV